MLVLFYLVTLDDLSGMNVIKKKLSASRSGPHIVSDLDTTRVGKNTKTPHCDAVQPQKMVKCLKFRIKEEEGLNYLYSENKGTDQQRR